MFNNSESMIFVSFNAIYDPIYVSQNFLYFFLNSKCEEVAVLKTKYKTPVFSKSGQQILIKFG